MNSIEKYIRISIIIIASVILAIIKTADIIVPKLYLETNDISINVFSKYNAYLNNKDITSSVIIYGNIDTNKIGDYEVTYEVKNRSFVTKKVLKIHVIDQIKPKIELEESEICDINQYIKKHVTVYDNYDGDISDKITYKMEDDNIVFEVSDSSGNIASKDIYKNANVKIPNIKLKGDKEIYLKLGESYNELGAIAYDSCNNDISSDIIITNNIDYNNVGKYEVIYKIIDENGLSNEINRIVNVYDEENSPGYIYLTFDDGPGLYTDEILDILNKYDIKATFFVTKNGEDETILREYNEGHTIGLHTYTHQWKIYSSEEAYYDDLNKIKDRVFKITGYESKFIRFPGGSSNTISRAYSKNIMSKLTNSVTENGYKYFDWNVSIEDAGACAKLRVKNKEECVINYFKSGISKKQANYVLMHDVKEYTKNALEEMILYAKENNYEFLKIDDNTIPHHHQVSN